jgi:multidrug transporter EmrE-like cation transporter
MLHSAVYYICMDNTDQSVVYVSLIGIYLTSFTPNLMSLKPKISYAEFGGEGIALFIIYSFLFL